MGKYKKILVAFDGSESSENALLQAFRLASDEKCWMTVTTVAPEYSGELDLTGVNNIRELLLRPGKELLSKANDIAKHEGALIKTVLEEGEIYRRIVDLAEAENCGVVVMGRRGASSFERALVGSVTARVIGHSQRDVLVVPYGTRIGWKKILLATDGSKHSFSAAERAIDFAKSYEAKLMVVSVIDVPDELYAEAPGLVDELIKKAKDYAASAREAAYTAGVEVDTEVREGESHEAIVSIARGNKEDLIVMGSHGRTGLKRLLMGSVTEKVIGHAPCPVLVVKAV
jgi:nucleotide-binding universal stress UspA family protein